MSKTRRTASSAPRIAARWPKDPAIGAALAAVAGLMWAAVALLAGVLVLQRLLQHVVRERQQDRPATSDLLHAVLRIALYLVALMLYLRFGLHLDISSVLATSAMMSVVIGLALQPTLGHLFAGVSMEIERPLKVGDFVRRDDQLEGQVTSLNWRSVYLRTERGSTLVKPYDDPGIIAGQGTMAGFQLFAGLVVDVLDFVLQDPDAVEQFFERLEAA